MCVFVLKALFTSLFTLAIGYWLFYSGAQFSVFLNKNILSLLKSGYFFLLIYIKLLCSLWGVFLAP